jgi:hypothetical protein
LERAVVVTKQAWSVFDLDGELFRVDVDKFLREFARNAAILEQFLYYRADIEVTLRINSNQFYAGAIAVTLFPSNFTGNRFDERMMLDPVVISASSAEAVIKKWDYMWPFAWKPTKSGELSVDAYPTNMVVDVLVPLLRAHPEIPDTVEVQVWARFVNIQLSNPKEPDAPAWVKKEKIQAQSATGKLTVQVPGSSSASHPAADSSAVGGGTLGGLLAPVGAVVSSVMSDAEQAVDSVASFVTNPLGSLVGLLAGFDKPDRAEAHTPIIIDAAVDMYNADVADSNVSVGLYKARYVDPGSGRMPMSKDWTISEYARIPGLRENAAREYVNEGDFVEYDLIRQAASALTARIPLDFAVWSSELWRGSIKICLMFFCSTFTSARFALTFINSDDSGGTFPPDYSYGVSKVINVKGDTIDTTTLPWLSTAWWDPGKVPKIKLEMITPVTSVDVALNTKISVLLWVAGGEDIQFAWPRIPADGDWAWNGAAPAEEIKSQSAPGSIFQKTFPPIAENVSYDIDQGYAHNESIGPISDLMKRYSVLKTTANTDSTFRGQVMDIQPDPDASATYANWYAFRRTLFGNWRSAFLFRSGGYRYRKYLTTNTGFWTIQTTIGGKTSDVTTYEPPHDGTVRLTIPQLSVYPFAMLTDTFNVGYIDIAGSADTSDDRAYLAARDDVQVGYPILPIGMPPAVGAAVEQTDKPQGRGSLVKTRGKREK